MALPRASTLLLGISLVLAGTVTNRGECATTSDNSEECQTYGNCKDPESVLKGIINIPENYDALFKAFHHTNHRNPMYVILTYALNRTTVPASECSSKYGSGVIPGNPINTSLQSWIWTTSPIHAIVSPFALVEFGLFTPWISYSLLKPKQSYSLLALHTSACVAVLYHFSNCDGEGRSNDECAAYIMASVTTVLKGAVEHPDWTYDQLATDAQYAMLIDAGTSLGGLVCMYVSLDDRFKVYVLQSIFYLLHLSLAVGISMVTANAMTKYAASIVRFSAKPEVHALIWAIVSTCFLLDIFLSFKLVLVGIVYVRNSAIWIGIMALSALILYTIIGFWIAISATPLYDKLCVPKTWQLLMAITSLGFAKSRRAVHALGIFIIGYFAPLIVLHLVLSVCCIMQDPLQHNPMLITLFLMACTMVCMLAVYYSVDFIFVDTGDTSSYKEKLESRIIPSIKHCAKYCYITMVFVFASAFLAALSAFGLLAKLKDFYTHYKVSNGVAFIVLPMVFSFASWAIRYAAIHFRTFLLPRDIPFH